MRTNVARRLVEMSVICFHVGFEILTPTIATELISGMVKKGGEVLESVVKIYVGSTVLC